MLKHIAHVLVAFRKPVLGNLGQMSRSFDVSTETGLSSDMVQLHGNSRARTWIVFGLFRASLLDLHISAIPHGHHIAYQEWAENCTCSRLLSRAQKTAEHRSSRRKYKYLLRRSFNLFTPSTTLMFPVSKMNEKLFYVRESGLRF